MCPNQFSCQISDITLECEYLLLRMFAGKDTLENGDLPPTINFLSCRTKKFNRIRAWASVDPWIIVDPS